MRALVKSAPTQIRMAMFSNDDHVVTQGEYKMYPEGNSVNLLGLVDDNWSLEDIVEEVFDLTNNPSRQDERVERYGYFQSVSVGDIVEVRGIPFLCKDIGWQKLDFPGLKAKSNATMVWAEVG